MADVYLLELFCPGLLRNGLASGLVTSAPRCSADWIEKRRFAGCDVEVRSGGWNAPRAGGWVEDLS